MEEIFIKVLISLSKNVKNFPLNHILQQTLSVRETRCQRSVDWWNSFKSICGQRLVIGLGFERIRNTQDEESAFGKFAADLNAIPPFHKACSDQSPISILRRAILLLQAMSHKSLLCLVYPHCPWPHRLFGSFFKGKETEERYLDAGKTGRVTPYSETERFYSILQWR